MGSVGRAVELRTLAGGVFVQPGAVVGVGSSGAVVWQEACSRGETGPRRVLVSPDDRADPGVQPGDVWGDRSDVVDDPAVAALGGLEADVT